MLYTYKKTRENLMLQGKIWGTIVTRDGSAEITVTDTPIALEEGNEFRIAVSHCTANGAFVACLVANQSESRELMAFTARRAGQGLSVNNTELLIESVQSAKRRVIVRMKTDKPIVVKSGGALRIMLERIENEGVREPHAIIGVMR